MAEPSLVDRKTEEDGVVIIQIRHPPVNALSTRVLEELEAAVTQTESDREARAVILTGDGPYFSAGADLKEIAAIGLERAPEIVRRGQALFSRIGAMRPPVIAAINGLALGGGLELALACDLRIAGESAKLGAPEVSYGLMPTYGGTQRLARLLGPSKAGELVFTGAMIAAPEALRIGLVNRLVPAGQELRAARDLAHTIAKKAPKAVAAAKRAIAAACELPIEQGLELERREFETEVLPSADLQEGIASFVERRPPKFRGA
jgi:enoyl-CoA hydratase/carnithine racemase